MKEGELIPSNDTLVSLGVTARLACAIMLRTRDQLVDMHAKVDHEGVDEMMTSIAQASESLKWITHMLDTAYVRILASACAHHAGAASSRASTRSITTRAITSWSPVPLH